MTGAELGAARLALGVTQAELGLLVGVHGVTICRWERSGRPVPAWVAGVVQAVLEGQTRQGGHLPRLADALREGGAVPCLALWGTAGTMPPRPWWVWVRRSMLAPLLRAERREARGPALAPAAGARSYPLRRSPGGTSCGAALPGHHAGRGHPPISRSAQRRGGAIWWRVLCPLDCPLD